LFQHAEKWGDINGLISLFEEEVYDRRKKLVQRLQELTK